LRKVRAGHVDRIRVCALAATTMAWILLVACRTLATRLPISTSDTALPTIRPSSIAVDATTLDRKLMFGYQGWFACPDDGSPLGAWEHWFRNAHAAAANVRVDMWPDTSELDADERCPTGLARPDGRAAELYSAYRLKTVDRHFRWMEEYDLPGVFLQRFTVGLDNPAILGFRDGVLRNVRTAAESRGRVFALMYDITGQPSESLTRTIERDWMYAVDTLGVIDSVRYLHHHGRPVLAIWGLGFTDRSATPEQAANLIDFFRNNPNPRYRVTLVGGVPARWRTRTKDSLRDRRWARVYRSFDVISPWTVGRFADDRETDRFYKHEVAHDLGETRRRRIDYMPVVFPGFSWHNMKPEFAFNLIPRRGGRFYWRQVERAIAQGTTMLYGAMFDEVDEGTAMFKLAASAQDAAADLRFVTLDIDGEPLPADWYLRLARETQRALRDAPATAGQRASPANRRR
jgi:hypothetical protein